MDSDSKRGLATGQEELDYEVTRTQATSAPRVPTDPENDQHSPSVVPKIEFKAGDKIGRYVVIRELGTGGFGHVLLADDEKLRRRVAIKFPRADRLSHEKQHFLEEGRSVARLDHPSIIKVYNIEETSDGLPFVVMEYVDGPTLRMVIKNQGLTFSETIRFLVQIANALVYAHSQTLIHRDLKPANVIIGQEGQVAKLMDFGMAMHDLTPEEALTQNPEGTPPYMAPEQVRGENHRLDGRTDIWGFGVMMYVMLTAQRPFKAKRVKEMLREICAAEPMAPSRINKQVPRELERICLKCLEKLMGSRYQSATELLDDLQNFGENWDSVIEESPEIEKSGVFPATHSHADTVHQSKSRKTQSQDNLSAFGVTTIVKVVPKGLRSFDEQDSEFFIDLLPGPKDRFGIPDSLRFWISRLSGLSTEPLPVGLLFGPSGCGKSSFVKAGLIPNLPDSIQTIYVEATPEDTERVLISKLEAIAPQAVDEDSSLAKIFGRIRRGRLISGHKLIIVIDQFEQWLHNNTDFMNQPLIQALRQCDGEHVACLLMVRDDFWMSATQFMSQLDMKVQEGVNALGIPLFDKRHARKVLTAYGVATEAIKSDVTVSESNFVSAAIDEISNNGKVIPVHLALFAQMMDSDSWDVAQLQKMGGWQGIGVHFLESIFGDKRNARHERTCRAILEQLLPDSSTDIKGTQKSLERLAVATGHPEKTPQLQDALELLDRKLRLITPTESDDVESKGQQHYQLAHDYLVNPIRSWLTERKKDSWKGRAKIRMDELSRQWHVRHENRFLPSPVEYISILFGVRKKSLDSPGRQLFDQASWFYAIRFGLAVLLVLAIAFSARGYWKSANYKLAKDKFSAFLIANAQEVPARLELLEPFGRDTVQRVINSQSAELKQSNPLRLLLAQAQFGNKTEFDYNDLLSQIPVAEPDECTNIVMTLGAIDSEHSDEILNAVGKRIAIAESDDERFRLSVVALHLGNSEYAKDLLKFRTNPQIRTSFIIGFPGWHGPLEPILRLIKESDDTAFVSGMLKSVGQLPKAQLTANQYDQLQSLAGEKLVNAESSAVHSAAEWTLTNQNMKRPSDLLGSANHSWFEHEFENGERVTFLRVAPQMVPVAFGLNDEDLAFFSKTRKRVPLNHSFYMSSKEVRASLFFKYLETLPEDNGTRVRFENSPVSQLLNQDLPIYGVKFGEAAAFCNWLSDEEQKVRYYKWDQTTTRWVNTVGADGYRMPSSLEWEAAVRAGTESRFFFGGSSDLLGQFAFTSLDKRPFDNIAIGLRGRKMPNDNGFFDMISNTAEWCQDHNENRTYEAEVKSTRGGDSMDSVQSMSSGACFDHTTSLDAARQGIRLVLDQKDH